MTTTESLELRAPLAQEVPPAPPPSMRLRELAFGAACAAALRAAARLGVADALGEGPMAVEDLAAAVKTEPRPL